MSSIECFHFTNIHNLYSIRDYGLIPKLDKNSNLVGDKKVKVSYSESKIGAIGLFVNFYEVYIGFKSGKRHPKNDDSNEIEAYRYIMNSKSFEDFLGERSILTFRWNRNYKRRW